MAEREKAPECRNPQCPGPRDQMVLVDATPSHYVFACLPCKDKHRVLSVQVRTKPTFRRHVREQIIPYRRALDVRKDRQGRITYFR